MVDVVPARTVVSRARAAAYSWYWVPLGIFLFTRMVGGLVLLLMSDQQSARAASPLMFVSDPAPAHPGYLDMLTNWDGQWYQQVVAHGYPSDLPHGSDGEVAQNTWAFYPVYPAMVRAVMALTSLPFAAAASLVSMVAAGAAMVLIFRMLEGRVGRFNASMTVLALCMSPAGLVLQLAYTESLGLLVLVGCLVLLERRRYGALSIMAVVLSLTRPIVLPLCLLIAIHGVLRWRRRGEDPFPPAERRRLTLAVVVSGASFGLWPLVCALRTGEPLGFLETQHAWISTYPGHGNWLLTILKNPTGGAAVLAVTALVVACAIVARPGARPWGNELRWWVPTYLLYLLVTASPVASSLRYAILAIVPWWPVTARGESLSATRRILIAVAVVAFGICCQLLWVRTLYVLGPHQLMFP